MTSQWAKQDFLAREVFYETLHYLKMDWQQTETIYNSYMDEALSVKTLCFTFLEMTEETFLIKTQF